MCIAYIRFHKALKVQGISRDSLPWKGPFQPYAAYFATIFCAIITLFSGFAIFLKGNWSTSDFFAAYVSESFLLDHHLDLTLRLPHLRDPVHWLQVVEEDQGMPFV